MKIRTSTSASKTWKKSLNKHKKNSLRKNVKPRFLESKLGKNPSLTIRRFSSTRPSPSSIKTIKHCKKLTKRSLMKNCKRSPNSLTLSSSLGTMGLSSPKSALAGDQTRQWLWILRIWVRSDRLQESTVEGEQSQSLSQDWWVTFHSNYNNPKLWTKNKSNWN